MLEHEAEAMESCRIFGKSRRTAFAPEDYDLLASFIDAFDEKLKNNACC